MIDPSSPVTPDILARVDAVLARGGFQRLEDPTQVIRHLDAFREATDAGPTPPLTTQDHIWVKPTEWAPGHEGRTEIFYIRSARFPGPLLIGQYRASFYLAEGEAMEDATISSGGGLIPVQDFLRQHERAPAIASTPAAEISSHDDLLRQINEAMGWQRLRTVPQAEVARYLEGLREKAGRRAGDLPEPDKEVFAWRSTTRQEITVACIEDEIIKPDTVIGFYNMTTTRVGGEEVIGNVSLMVSTVAEYLEDAQRYRPAPRRLPSPAQDIGPAKQSVTQRIRAAGARLARRVGRIIGLGRE